jgi:peroxiredoxin family protein
MADSLAVMVSSGTREAISTALDVLEAAVAMEMESHLYLTGPAVAWAGQGPGDGEGAPAGATEQARAAFRARLREIKEEGELKVYACSRAMGEHGVPKGSLAPEVDMPAGFAYFLSLASEASVTLNL